MAAPIAPTTADVSLEAAAGLFGGRPATAVEASNFQLKGVVLADNGSESVAILATDGKPARAVRVNTEFQPGVMISEVHAQYVLLTEGGIVKRVALPDPGRAAQQTDFGTGGLPPLAPQPSPPQYQPQPQSQSQQVQPQAYMAPQAPVQIVNPLPGQMQGQQPAQAMPAPPGQGLPGQTMPAPARETGVFLPSRPQ